MAPPRSLHTGEERRPKKSRFLHSLLSGYGSSGRLVNLQGLDVRIAIPDVLIAVPTSPAPGLCGLGLVPSHAWPIRDDATVLFSPLCAPLTLGGCGGGRGNSVCMICPVHQHQAGRAHCPGTDGPDPNPLRPPMRPAAHGTPGLPPFLPP